MALSRSVPAAIEPTRESLSPSLPYFDFAAAIYTMPRIHIPTLLKWRNQRDAIRAGLEVIPDPDPQGAHHEVIRRILQHREVIVRDDREYLQAGDGTLHPVGEDVWRGLRSIAAAEVLGLNRTHSMIEVQRGMVTVTLIQPSRRDADSIRRSVLADLLAAPTAGHFDSIAQSQRATRAERHLAQRVHSLRGVGTRTSDDWDIRNRVGVTIQEIRSH